VPFRNVDINFPVSKPTANFNQARTTIDLLGTPEKRADVDLRRDEAISIRILNCQPDMVFISACALGVVFIGGVLRRSSWNQSHEPHRTQLNNFNTPGFENFFSAICVSWCGRTVCQTLLPQDIWS
jgi:hypothetical protein